MSHLNPLEKVFPVAYFIVTNQQGLCLFPSFFLLQFPHCFFKDSISKPLVKFIVTINVRFGNILCCETEYSKVWRSHRFSKVYKWRCMTVSPAVAVLKLQNTFWLLFYVSVCLHSSSPMPSTNVFLTCYS